MSDGPPPPPDSMRLKIARIAALVFVIMITVGVYAFQNRLEALKEWGYLGICLINVLANATIILPAPGLAIVFAMGGVQTFSPAWVGIAAGLGAAVGEFSGYLVGFSGQALIEQRHLFERFSRWLKKYGAVTITLLAFLPLPVFDVAGIAAGALKMKPQTFFIYCALGKIPKMLLVAYAGYYSVGWVTQWLR
jgi:uncharacterized membrane protein YdjX (TVP38/TMEM64 family)